MLWTELIGPRNLSCPVTRHHSIHTNVIDIYNQYINPSYPSEFISPSVSISPRLIHVTVSTCPLTFVSWRNWLVTWPPPGMHCVCRVYDFVSNCPSSRLSLARVPYSLIFFYNFIFSWLFLLSLKNYKNIFWFLILKTNSLYTYILKSLILTILKKFLIILFVT